MLAINRLRLASALVPLLESDLSEVTRIAKAGELATALARRNGILAATFWIAPAPAADR
jgi:hypothetical protein